MTCNLNGIRSATTKGFWDWATPQKADVMCLQEVRAAHMHIPEQVLALKKYYQFWQLGNRPGYSGVGILCKEEPKKVFTEFGHKVFDEEGRFLHLELEKLNVISLYLPSGSSGELRQNIKFECLEAFFAYLKKIKRNKKPFVICGDFNIAHTNADIKNWKSNQKNSGFLPEERQWMSDVIDDLGYVDAFRAIHPDKVEYTWWSNRGRARENNVGWRIDYHLVSPALKSRLKSIEIYRDKFFSDHAPQTLVIQSK